MKNFMDARVKELMAIGASFTEAHTAALEEWKAQNTKPRKGTGAKAPQPKAEKVEYTKSNGDVILASPKQVAHFESLKAQAPERKAKFDAMCAEWNAKHEAYVPSKELIEAIKHDRASITRKVAKEKYGFVGTKDDLKALKEKVLAK